MLSSDVNVKLKKIFTIIRMIFDNTGNLIAAKNKEMFQERTININFGAFIYIHIYSNVSNKVVITIKCCSPKS